jgi:hypothetical protein
VFNAVAKGDSAVEAMTDAITHGDWGNTRDYLVDEQRTLLARMDVHAGLGRTEQERAAMLSQIFRAVLQTGQIDTQIATGFAETVSVNALRRAMFAKHDNSVPRLSIVINDANADPQTRMSYGKFAKIAASAAWRRMSGNIEAIGQDNDAPAAVRTAQDPALRAVS